MTTAVQAALAAGALQIAAAFGVGGDRWDVSAPGGDGLSGPALAPAIGLSLGVWAGHVKRAEATALTPAAPGVPAPAELWHAIGADDVISMGGGFTTPLAAGHTLTSQADPSLRFRVAASVRVAGYARFILEPC